MADPKLVRALNHLLTAARDDRSVSDGELLRRFISQNDAAALELLVWRYQRLVFGICRRVLQDEHDAEDAFQATFLVLVRKARSVSRQEALGGWLYQVATRTALAARAARSRRTAHECSPGGHNARSASQVDLPAERRELETVVDEEVSRLPERFRRAVVLCYLEGKTVDEAAHQLGWPRGTVASRLARARERLRIGLTRRGITLTVGTLAAGLSEVASVGARADGLVRRTGQAVAAFLAGHSAAGQELSRTIIALSEEVLRAMFLRKLTAGAAILVVGLMVLGGGQVLRLHFSAAAEPPPVAAASAPLPAPEDKAAPVTISLPVRREVAPLEDFTGRLERVESFVPNSFATTLPPKPMAVRFEIDERSYLRYQRLLKAGQVKGAGDPLAVGVADESDLPRAGVLDHFGNEVILTTGTVAVYGVLSNTDGLLLPGMFARVRMTFGPPRPVLEVPDEAIFRDQNRACVWVVTDQKTALRRNVRAGAHERGMRVIEEGLRPEDRIIIAGGLRLKPGDRVEPQPAGQSPGTAK
jgi:RNA polymerase sigma factor (sigma-70 family)